MEDDCPQGGDDVRLCLLKTLGAHNHRTVPCVGCRRDMVVYDRYPLVDGVFFLSPVCHFGPPTEVMYDGKRNYLQQLCASCLWSDWRCNTAVDGDVRREAQLPTTAVRELPLVGLALQQLRPSVSRHVLSSDVHCVPQSVACSREHHDADCECEIMV
ncbi:hypothetical protein OESDEN_11156 [Oesophagostomum dentatum]|uniref:Headcase middle domain-containing protein n=1 Tax=Oesophagostomum dentatum TaxID=61180 RepID=A0A0B1SUN9_OESDE|nr:hypothetical protein OESDEN_11156 [Oesophagostomum dentatum]